jgi:hypothetical protein
MGDIPPGDRQRYAASVVGAKAIVLLVREFPLDEDRGSESGSATRPGRCALFSSTAAMEAAGLSSADRAANRALRT